MHARWPSPVAPSRGLLATIRTSQSCEGVARRALEEGWLGATPAWSGGWPRQSVEKDTDEWRMRLIDLEGKR